MQTDIHFEIAISIDTESQLQFQKEIGLASTDPAIESACLNGVGNLTCLLKVRAASAEEAKAKSLWFADKVADILSYRYRVKTKTVAITCCSYTDGKNVTVTPSGLQLNAFLGKVVVPDDGAILSQFMARKLLPIEYDLLGMYRQALNEESPLARYLLFYRLLEYKLGHQGEVDAWIMTIRPSTTQVPGQRRSRKPENITIYTDLRNRIHPRTTQTLFPYQEVINHADELEKLVRIALDEACQSP